MRSSRADEAPLSFTRILIIIGLVCGALALLVALSGYEPPLPAAMVEQYERGNREDAPMRKRAVFNREQQEEGPSDVEENEEVRPSRRERLLSKRRHAQDASTRRTPALAAEEPTVQEAPRKRVLVKACPACPACADPLPCPAAPLAPPPAAPVSAPCPSGAAAIVEYDGYAVERVDRSRNAVFSTLSEAVAATKHPRLNLATFIQGNAGFHPLTKNWIAMVRALSPALPYFVVALDEVEAGNVKALGAPVYLETRKKYDPSASSYRETGYNQMTLNKWGVTRDILKSGVSVFMVDPDIAMLRNPLPYFETLPTCDFVTMVEGYSMDMDGDGHVDATFDELINADKIVNKGGFSQKAYHRTYDNLMNTGYSLFRSTPHMIALMDEFEGYVTEKTSDSKAEKVEDQTLWADFIQDRFFIKAAGPDASAAARGTALVDAIIHGRCVEYARRSDGASGSIVWTFFPLNPIMFMNRPAHDMFNLHRKMLEQPFAVHYNYLVGTDAKVNGMKLNGHYVVA